MKQELKAKEKELKNMIKKLDTFQKQIRPSGGHDTRDTGQRRHTGARASALWQRGSADTWGRIETPRGEAHVLRAFGAGDVLFGVYG